MPQQSHFEKLIAEAMDELKAACMTIPAEDSHRVARTQGKHEGLNVALSLYKRAMKIDADPDGDGL